MNFLLQYPRLFMLSAPSASGEGGSSMIQTFMFMGLIFVVFWFFMIRPQKQKQKQRTAMLKSLEKGDRIVTIGGIRGVVAKVSDDVVSMKVDESCKIEFSRTAIAEVLLDEKESARRTAEAKNSSAEKVEKKKDLAEPSAKKQNGDKGEEGAL